MNQRKPYRGVLRPRQSVLPLWKSMLFLLLLVLAGIGEITTRAGGSGLNVVVVANQNSANSLELANYYLQRRSVPPEQLLRISWAGGNIEWTEAQFRAFLLDPLLAWVSAAARSNQVQYVVLSMDIPYRISGGLGNSTTAALFYGIKRNGDAPNSSYAFSESVFAFEPPVSAPTNAFLAMMITANSIDEARRIIDQGVASDGTSPTQTVWLAKSDDVSRNQRYRKYDDAIFSTQLCDGYALARTNQSSPGGWTDILGYQAGVAQLNIASNAFIPGAIADTMTSFGGKLFENPGQTTLLEFTEAGAAGSYGTVTEPTASVAKFPDPRAYFYQARGFSLAECYYQSVQQPFQGLFVGEPLAAPWRRYANAVWSGIGSNAWLTGRTNVCVNVLSGVGGTPMQRLDLYVEGQFWKTLTNLPPRAGNRLVLRLNGYEVSYTVPSNATLKSISTGLAGEVNKPANTSITKVTAQVFGDRIQLQSLAAPLPEGVFEVVDNEATVAEPRTYLAAASPISRVVSVAAGGWTAEGAFRVQFNSSPAVSNVLEASTNLRDWTVVSTNAQGGAMEYLDIDAALYPQRFYRAALPPGCEGPELRALGINESNEFVVHIASPTNRPFVLQGSSDFRLWSDLFTNSVGGDSEFVDGTSPGHGRRFYRTRSADTNDYAPITLVGLTPTGGNILRVKATTPGELVVWSSTNSSDWVPIYTHNGQGMIQTETATASTAGEPLTTQLVAARSDFLPSTAQGLRKFGVEPQEFLGSLTSTSYLWLEVTKTNGAQVSVTVTNPPGNLGMSNLVVALVEAVNAHPELTQQDGVEADDVMDGFPGQIVFELHARGAGQLAAEVHARLRGSADLRIEPSPTVKLNENLTDLLPRNHLYVRAGVSSLYHEFDLDTTELADGHHELTAVAYEGSHVHSQTHATVKVQVHNTPLQAWLTLEGGGTNRLVTDTLQFTVTANTNTVSEILLGSTGGLLRGVTNQAQATFNVAGSFLGAGQHPFFATVTTTNGLRYRTDKLVVNLLHP